MSDTQEAADLVEVPFYLSCHYCGKSIRTTSPAAYHCIASKAGLEDLPRPDKLYIHWPDMNIQCEGTDTRASEPPAPDPWEDEDYIYYGRRGAAVYQGNPYGLYGGYM